ncbi:hypothetical protein AGMMS49940_11470 [Spirochaetia bacterium]|nr:hypothetical protein AGMMS49940_11470 [Spirochaetia bacterium]
MSVSRPMPKNMLWKLRGKAAASAASSWGYTKPGGKRKQRRRTKVLRGKQGYRFIIVIIGKTGIKAKGHY